MYPLTRVGVSGLDGFDYNRVTEPGPIFVVRLPGIYADVANTKGAILETNYTNGKITQETGFAAAFGGNTSHSRTLAPNEKVYVMQILPRHDAVLFDLLTVDVVTLGDGRGTRYRSELNIKLPGLDTMTPEDMKKVIDTVLRLHAHRDRAHVVRGLSATLAGVVGVCGPGRWDRLGPAEPDYRYSHGVSHTGPTLEGRSTSLVSLVAEPAARCPIGRRSTVPGSMTRAQVNTLRRTTLTPALHPPQNL